MTDWKREYLVRGARVISVLREARCEREASVMEGPPEPTVNTGNCLPA